MIPDVIVTWPHACDYPLWRKFIRDERHRFARVLICFTENMQGPYDFRPFVRAQLGDIAECFDSPPLNGRDWRDVAVNAALDRSDAEWVWFTEQDFRVLDEGFWRYLAPRWTGAVVGWLDQTPRLHPSSLLVSRWAIDRTARYFGPFPRDHFATFSDELAVNACYLLPDDGSWTHMQGLSHNHFLMDTGQPVTFKPDEFHAYLRECLTAGVALDPEWQRRAENAVGALV